MSTRDTIVLVVSVLAGVWIFGGVSGFTFKFLTKMKMSPEYDLGVILYWPATWSPLVAAFLGVALIIGLAANIGWLSVLTGLPFAGYLLGRVLRWCLPIKS